MIRTCSDRWNAVCQVPTRNVVVVVSPIKNLKHGTWNKRYVSKRSLQAASNARAASIKPQTTNLSAAALNLEPET